MKFLSKLLRKPRSKKRIVMPGKCASGMYASSGWVKTDASKKDEARDR